uniref:DUF7032 domain-containing protein n=1 Tax=Ananas comosus var. bracteatus TaxID=296719 RepID=A0A6V7Q9K7_ANACO|nr:unnamed protein product [Ananas comosus var. bracteatus]
MTNVAEDDADPLAIILHRLLPLLLVAALSVKTFVSRWRLVHSNLLRLQSLLSGSSCCHPLFVCLVRSLVPELSGLLSLSRRCLDPSLPDGKLHLQSDLDIASSTLALRLHDLRLLLLHSTSASSAIVLPVPSPSASRADVVLFVRDAFARLQIGGLDLKLDALQSLQDLLDSGGAAAAEIVAGEGDTTAAVLRLLDHPVLRDRAAALTASLAASSAASRRAVFDEGGLGPLLRLLDPSLAAPPPPATAPPPPSPPSPPTPPPPGASRPTAAFPSSSPPAAATAARPPPPAPSPPPRSGISPPPTTPAPPWSRRAPSRARRSRRLRHARRPKERRIVPPLPRLRPRRRPDPIDPNPRIRTTAAPPIAGARQFSQFFLLLRSRAPRNRPESDPGTVASPGLQQNSPLVAAILHAARRPRPPQRQRHSRGAARRPLPRRRRSQSLPRAVHVRPREDDGIVEAADRAGDGGAGAGALAVGEIEPQGAGAGREERDAAGADARSPQRGRREEVPCVGGARHDGGWGKRDAEASGGGRGLPGAPEARCQRLRRRRRRRRQKSPAEDFREPIQELVLHRMEQLTLPDPFGKFIRVVGD